MVVPVARHLHQRAPKILITGQSQLLDDVELSGLRGTRDVAGRWWCAGTRTSVRAGPMATWEKNERVSGFHSWLDERWYGLVWPQVDGSGWSWNIIDTGRAPRGAGDGIEVGSAQRPRGSPGRCREQVARSWARHPLVILHWAGSSSRQECSPSGPCFPT